MKNVRRSDLIEPDLSYQVVGALYDVFNALGTGHREIVYKRALATALKDRGLKVAEELYTPLTFKGRVIGRWRLDFLVEGRIVVEMKRGERIMKRDIEQVLEYLKTHHLRLGILANVAPGGVQFKRVINL